jgi:chemotaxis protein methyltransferase CheR
MRSKVTFRQLNLLSEYNTLGRFDVIYCRNVLIYFDAARKADILTRMTRQLAPDGYVVLGASESLIGLKTDLIAHPEHRALFVRGANGAAPELPMSRTMPAAATAPALAATKRDWPATSAAASAMPIARR